MSKREETPALTGTPQDLLTQGGDGPFHDGSGREGKGTPVNSREVPVSDENCRKHEERYPYQREAIVIYPIGWWGKSPDDDPPAHSVTACY